MTYLKTSRYGLLLGAGLAMIVNLPAEAQNALGGGNALDNSLSTRGRSNVNNYSDFDSELRFRNAIVTGNAPGGLGFRGDVGYRAAGDFTGGSEVPFQLRNQGVSLGLDAGSNDSFAFERDSFYSGLATRGIRGVDALQYQMKLQTGSVQGELPVLPILRRPSHTLDTQMVIDSGRLGADPLSLSAYSISPGTLRSTTEFLSNSYLDPAILSIDRSDDTADPSFTIATPLRGVAVQSAPTFSTDILTTDLMIPKTSSELINEFRSPNQVSGLIEPMKAQSSYDEILSEIRAFNDDGDAPSDLNQPIPPQQPGGARPGIIDDFSVDQAPQLPGDSNLLLPGDPGATQLPSLTIEDRLSQLRNAMSVNRSERISKDERLRKQVSDTIDMLKNARPIVSNFAPETNEERDLFTEHMNLGQRLLESGRWFDAEEHFASALSMRPGDALAAVGRIHAELGAGLFLSAAVNLQKMLRENPGMISVVYDAKLLPKQSRIDQVFYRLRENIKRSSAMGRNSGFLLAYLGYQTGNQDMVTEGFSAIDRITGVLGEDPNPFYDVVRQVWVK